MRSIELEIRNPSGLHARPAALFVRTAGALRSRVRVRNLTRDGADVDAKSLLSVLGLGVSHGHRIAIQAEGEDEEAAIAAMRDAIESGLGEPVAPATQATATGAIDAPGMPPNRPGEA
ncbi:MAG TPA: HPr family phosphocarrier protein [Candidatus Limnocylindrales bacterium]|nr:HPr family phosphocarrier protein [Candidatus Limnocylindrales bacterium]